MNFKKVFKKPNDCFVIQFIQKFRLFLVCLANGYVIQFNLFWCARHKFFKPNMYDVIIISWIDWTMNSKKIYLLLYLWIFSFDLSSWWSWIENSLSWSNTLSFFLFTKLNKVTVNNYPEICHHDWEIKKLILEKFLWKIFKLLNIYLQILSEITIDWTL